MGNVYLHSARLNVCKLLKVVDFELFDSLMAMMDVYFNNHLMGVLSSAKSLIHQYATPPVDYNKIVSQSFTNMTSNCGINSEW